MSLDFYGTKFDQEIFGDRWCGPDFYERGVETLIAKYESSDEDDGQPVEVYAKAYPAVCYTVKALPGVNSLGENQSPYELATGTIGPRIVEQIAESISDGMIVLLRPEEPVL